MPFREGLNSGLRNIGERGMAEVLPGLFIGSAKDSVNLEELRRNGITHVVSVHDAAKKEFRELRYLILHLPDSDHQNMTKYIREVNDFIHSARLGNGRVLVHCIHGISRSPFFLLAYLLSTCNASLEEAHKVLIIIIIIIIIITITRCCAVQDQLLGPTKASWLSSSSSIHMELLLRPPG